MEILTFLDDSLWIFSLFCVGIYFRMWMEVGPSSRPRQGILNISSYPNWFRALLPFTWVACLVVAVFHGLISTPVELSEGGLPLLIAGDVLCALIYPYIAHDWYLRWKNTDDDYWKKKRERMSAKIREIAGKLVVVPKLAPVRA